VHHSVLFSADQIREKVSELAESIDSQGYESILAVTVLNGAVIFSSDLVRAMDTDTELRYLSASSYVDGFTPGEEIVIDADHELGAEGRHVLIVEDIVDTGRTLTELGKIISAQNPLSVSTVTLINKTDRRDTGFTPTYAGFEITTELVYGYGMDWNERFRDLPYIAIANPQTRP
jgi:hypoxanthine phosphoribosyltransferase